MYFLKKKAPLEQRFVLIIILRQSEEKKHCGIITTATATIIVSLNVL
jgi:hypothetical protein